MARRTKFQREQDLARLEEMDRHGYTQEQMAQICGVSRRQVYKDMVQVRQVLRQATIEERHYHVAQVLRGIYELRRKAWEAFEASERAGEPSAQWHKALADTFKEERKLLGLDAPEKHEHELGGTIEVEYDYGKLTDAQLQQFAQLLAIITPPETPDPGTSQLGTWPAQPTAIPGPDPGAVSP